MARFSLRPLFRRVSSKQSITATTNSNESEGCTTAATSVLPTPDLPDINGSAVADSNLNLSKPPKICRSQTSSPSCLENERRRSESSTSKLSSNSSRRSSPPSSDFRTPPAHPQRKDSLGAGARRRLQSLKLGGRRQSASDLDHRSLSPVDRIDEQVEVPGLVLRRPTAELLEEADPAEDEFELPVDYPEEKTNHDRPPLHPHPSKDAASSHHSHEPSVQVLESIPDVSEVVIADRTTDSSEEPSSEEVAVMAQRKIWVKRPNASATLVQIRESDVVDEVRDMILRKYANSLGKTFDAPDMNLSISSRTDNGVLRVLGPEEEICKVIDAAFPNGQTIHDALVIDVPMKRTPKPSPRHVISQYHNMDDWRPHENGTDYFPPVHTLVHPAAPHLAHGLVPAEHPPQRSMAVINGGVLPNLPSPGSVSRMKHRPKIIRQHTSSPVLPHSATTASNINGTGLTQQQQPHLPIRAIQPPGRPRHDSTASDARANIVPAPPPLPTPPAVDSHSNKNGSTPPTPNSGVGGFTHAGRPIRGSRKPRKSDKSLRNRPQQSPAFGSNPTMPSISSMLDASVPPINVLIVEDNIINLRILEGLMKRLKVRWQTAMNGQIAVDKWRLGGFHLVLMDIQMPIMNGLQATKEIRRLERVNGIGAFSSSSPTSPLENNSNTANGSTPSKPHDPEDDKLVMSEGLFKSPIIIVALTASSLQSDRHEALAAGCNDFLTKPVNFVWLERKVKEWGCMQALIDFDGWRKWKDYAAKEEAGKTEAQKEADRVKEEKDRIKAEKLAKLQEMAAERERVKKANAAAAAAGATVAAAAG